jgi:hypothetical protein
VASSAFRHNAEVINVATMIIALSFCICLLRN